MSRQASWTQIAIAFLAVYLLWGSTYLAIRYAVETIPPYLMAGGRVLTAGAVLYLWGVLRGEARPTVRQWQAAAIVGGLMLCVANGTLGWTEQYLPTGVCALLIAMVPLWMVVLEWLGPAKKRPDAQVMVGIAGGLIGMAILMQPWRVTGQSVHPGIALILVLSSMAWAVGALYSRTGELPKSALRAISMEMLMGGLFLMVFSSAIGEWHHFSWQAVSTRSWLALAYLIVFGSMIGFTAYIWLFQVVPPAQVGTTAYVNPVVALLIGAWLGGEPLGPVTLMAGAVIIGSVVVISLPKRKAQPVPEAVGKLAS